jgi:hypothetical protein
MSRSNSSVNSSVISAALNDLHVKRDSDDDNKTPFLNNENVETGIGSLQDKVRAKSTESLRHSNEFEETLRNHSSLIDPDDAAKWLNPFHAVNLAIFASYLSVGFGMYFIQTPITFYMVDSLNATPGQLV